MTVTDSFNYRQKTHSLHATVEQLKDLHEEGFVLIPNVLSKELVESAREHIDQLKPFGFDRLGNTDHFKNVFNRDPFWLQFIDWPGVIDLAEASMGSECHIIGQTAWRSHPGHDGWGVHTDRLFVQMPEDMAEDPRFTLPIMLCTAHFYLNDIDDDLCPTWVIPGSHKSGGPPKADPDGVIRYKGREPEPVVCKAGDVLFFRSEVWHSGSKNNTEDKTRYLLQVHYSNRVVAQQFSPYLSWQYNPEVIAACNPRQRRLLGDHKPGAYD